LAPFFFDFGKLLDNRSVPDLSPATALNRLVAKEYVAVRGWAVAVGGSSGVSSARSGREQGDGSDQDGKNAFHGCYSYWRLGTRSGAIDGRKNIDSVIAEKHWRAKDNFSISEIIREGARADLLAGCKPSSEMQSHISTGGRFDFSFRKIGPVCRRAMMAD
jgi:hypothetical protein